MTVAYKNLLGRAARLIRDGDPGAADAICQHVLAVDPGNTVAMYVSGLVALERHDHERSLDMMNRAIAARPDFAGALCGRGIVRRHLRQSEAALDDFERAIALDPKQAQAHFYIGLALLERNALEPAAEKFETALRWEPAMAMVLANLGLVRHRQGRLDEAVSIYRRALEIDPSQTPTRNNLAGALQQLGRAAEALDILRTLDAEADDPMIGANLLTCLNLVPADPEGFRDEARRWAKRFADPLAEAAPSRSAAPDRRLRVGYIGGDGFRSHSLAMTFLPLLRAHDRAQFDIVAYSDVRSEEEDGISRDFKAVVTHWRQTAKLNDEALAALIRADEIDVLVDAAGFSAGSRLLALARRPAPVQVHFPVMSTSGMAAMDYLVGDDRLFPDGSEAFFVERLWRLPCAYLYAPPFGLPDVTPPPALRVGRITFGSFNRVAKIGSEAVDTWARILCAVPDSRMIIKSSTGMSAETAKRYAEQFGRHGVGADRLDFRGPTSDRGHFQQFGEIDIALDTFPHGGVVTTLDTLAMGVPTVSLVGRRPLELYGCSILGAIGFEDGLAETKDDYVARAVALAGDTTRLTGLRTTLRKRLLGSALCDAQAFARSIESAYRAMWRRWCAGEAEPP